ncbi:MAG TPA: hypothetical protein VFY14_13570 [Streptomyces sp.]|nr:hypothetical protein [Streptomyces sp.]
MSSNSTPTGIRDPLPKDDSLSAFAEAAFGPRKRRPKKTSDEPKPPVEEKPAEPEPQASAPEASPATVVPELATAPATEEVTPRPEPAEEQPVSIEAVAEPTSVPAPVPAPAANRETAVPPATDRPAAQAPVVRHKPRPQREVTIQVPDLGPEGARATQCTIMVSATVRDRFARYQLARKTEKGTEPTNAVVVRRAVLHARRHDLFPQLLETVRHRAQPLDDEDHDPDDLFGAVPGRRVERGRIKDSVQQSFRPSYQELAVIDAITAAYGFPSRSDFLDAALDAFLPPLPADGSGSS